MKLSSLYNKKSTFVKEQEVTKLLSSFGWRKGLDKIPVIAPILFLGYKMNGMKTKVLLAGEKFMLQIHLKSRWFVYSSACGPFTKNKEIIQKCKDTGDTRYIYQNKLGKACIQHEEADGDFKIFLED